MKNTLSLFLVLFAAASPLSAQKLTDYVNPFLGTTTLWEPEDLGYVRHRETRTWGAETFPGASLPNAMVQATPVTMYHSGSGYQYEDKTIFGFAHTAKGHWNLAHVPILKNATVPGRGGRRVKGRFVQDKDLQQGKTLIINTK